MLPVEPSARTYTLADLMARVRAGQVRVPHFQRGLRWTSSDAVALVDSVLRGFPIGSLLLWKRPGPPQRVTLGDVTIDAPDMDNALYVVDGQQRITAFLNAFDPIAGESGQFALVYDIKEEPFKVRARRSTEHESIPLPILFDLQKLLRWTRDNPKYLDLIDTINEATTRLREFHVPAYEVRSDDDRALRDIYDRMNNAGKRLSRAEAFWGLFAPEESAGSDLFSLTSLQEHAETARGWGRIDDDTILRIFLARRGHDVTRDIHQEFDDERRQQTEFPGESQQTAYQQALEALDRSISFLQNDAQVPHFTFLAYRYLLVVLARFFAHFPNPSARNRDLLIRWYWRAALVGPAVARGSATGAMRLLATCVRPNEETRSIQDLLKAVNDKPKYQPNAFNFRSNYSESHLMLCALWDASPKNPDTGERFTLDELSRQIGGESTPRSACPEIFSRALLPENLKAAIGNRVLMPGIPREAIGESLLRRGLFSSDKTERILESHLLPTHGVDHFGAAEVASLVQRRTELLDGVITNFLTRVAADGLDDSPPLDELNFDEDEDENDSSDDELTW